MQICQASDTRLADFRFKFLIFNQKQGRRANGAQRWKDLPAVFVLMTVQIRRRKKMSLGFNWQPDIEYTVAIRENTSPLYYPDLYTSVLLPLVWNLQLLTQLSFAKVKIQTFRRLYELTSLWKIFVSGTPQILKLKISFRSHHEIWKHPRFCHNT